MRDGFVKHMVEQMLDRGFIEQPQQTEYTQNIIKKRMKEIVLGEKQFVQNRPMIRNFHYYKMWVQFTNPHSLDQ